MTTDPDLDVSDIKELCARLTALCKQYEVREWPSLRRIEAKLLAAIHNRKLKGEGE